MASSLISDLADGQPLRAITVELESDGSGNATYTTTLAGPVFGKAYSYKVAPVSGSAPTSTFGINIADGAGDSVLRGALSSLSNSTNTEATIKESGAVAPYVLSNTQLVFSGSGMSGGAGKKVRVTLFVLR